MLGTKLSEQKKKKRLHEATGTRHKKHRTYKRQSRFHVLASGHLQTKIAVFLLSGMAGNQGPFLLSSATPLEGATWNFSSSKA